MLNDDTQAIVEEYETNRSLYADFTETTKDLAEELLRTSGVDVHSVTSRVKNKNTLKQKLSSAGGEYSKLGDVKDICGIRIITYFEDDVDRAAEVIETEFEIDQENSVDKRAQLDADRFGYLSLHYIAKLTGSRLALTEYQRFSDCQAEIQIRTILQHAWAEIEHDLGYKSERAVPSEERRRFSRVAGLLEVADTEFVQLRDRPREYQAHVALQIDSTPESIRIDQASLRAFIWSEPNCHRVRQAHRNRGELWNWRGRCGRRPNDRHAARSRFGYDR